MPVNLTSDDIITIYIYIFVRANIPELASYCNFIEIFVKEKELNFLSE